METEQRTPKQIREHEYYLLHKDKINARNKAYHKAHPEKMKEYRQKNAEKRSEYGRQYYLEHKEKINAYNREWSKRNPEKTKAYRHKYNVKAWAKEKKQRHWDATDTEKAKALFQDPAAAAHFQWIIDHAKDKESNTVQV